MPDINTWASPSCPSACGGTLNYSALPADPNCVSVPPLSEISDIFIQPTGAPAPFNYSGGQPTAVSGAIDNTNTDNTKCKHLVVIGEQGDPEETEYNGPKGTVVISKRRYLVEARLPITDQGYYTFATELQCNVLNFSFWIGTRGGYLFGGDGGISPASSNARLPKVAGEDGVEEAVILLAYDSDNGDPPRHLNPLAS